jgi:hypothetical protein
MQAVLPTNISKFLLEEVNNFGPSVKRILIDIKIMNT